MSAIEHDAPETEVEYDEGDATEAFMKGWGEDASAKKPSKEAPATEEDTDEHEPEADDDEADEQSSDEDGEQEGEEEDGEDADKDGDDVVVKIKVGEETKEAKLSELKRLYGQEAALTRKSQMVAEQRKALDTQAQVHAKGLESLLERARKRYEPYSNIDFLAAAKNPDVSAEELSAVRDAAMAAYADVQYLEQELSSLGDALYAEQNKLLREQAAEAIKVLSDPETGIEGWGPKLYGDIRSFAVDQGLDQDIVNKLVDPAAIKLIHKAMLYARGKQKVKSEPGKKKAPKKIIKSSASPAEQKPAMKAGRANDAMKRLRVSGSTDDAAEAFLTRWNDKD